MHLFAVCSSSFLSLPFVSVMNAMFCARRELCLASFVAQGFFNSPLHNEVFLCFALGLNPQALIQSFHFEFKTSFCILNANENHLIKGKKCRGLDGCGSSIWKMEISSFFIIFITNTTKLLHALESFFNYGICAQRIIYGNVYLGAVILHPSSLISFHYNGWLRQSWAVWEGFVKCFDLIRNFEWKQNWKSWLLNVSTFIFKISKLSVSESKKFHKQNRRIHPRRYCHNLCNVLVLIFRFDARSESH